MSKDTVAELKEARTHAFNIVDDLEAQLVTTAGAAEPDKEAIKAAKAKLKAAKAALRRADTAITKEEKRIEREAEKAAKAEAKAAEKAEKVAEKEAAEKAKDADKEAKAEAAEEAKKAKAAAREAARMPEQNGIRRPKKGTKTGDVWEMIESLNKGLGQTTPIKNLLDHALAKGYEEATIKAQYARWRKFNGVTGRITLPADEVA